MPKFSVIVPAHNSQNFISKGLDSIVNQSYRDYELIIICDKCRDQTDRIAYDYADIVKITDYGNDGLARNAGLDEASGDWILFMDHDDWWLHEYAFQIINDNVDSWSAYGDLDILQFGFIFRHQGYAPPIRNNGAIWPNVWSKCWKRSYIGDTRFKDIQMESDLYFTLKLITQARQQPNIKFLEQPLYYYNYMFPGSQTWLKKHGLPIT